LGKGGNGGSRGRDVGVLAGGLLSHNNKVTRAGLRFWRAFTSSSTG
jgi:hypothetical protein